MSVRVDISWLLATMLVSVRVAAATALAPVFGPTQIPGAVRVMLALAFGAMIVSALSPTPQAAVGSAFQLTEAAACELAIGASLSFGMLAAYAATQVAGRALDVQIGFGVASVFNPETQGFAPLLGTVFGMTAIAVFLAMDGHHVLVRALELSVQAVPPGSISYTLDWEAVLRQSGVMFSFGAALAGPVMLALLLCDLAMAVLARSMPALNVFVLSFSVKIVLGLSALAASIRLGESLLATLYGRTFEYWGHMAGAGVR
jgi:flagellar biosynthesis protein FliR